MVLSDEELKALYDLICAADLQQLVGIQALVQSFSEGLIKDSNEKLALLLDSYEKGKGTGEKK